VSVGDLIAKVLCVVVLTGCERSPLDFDCPELTVGDLVVTEVRGAQSGDDVYGDWLELFNASGRTIALRGSLVTITALDGSRSAEILVRDPMSVPAGEYFVFGRQTPGSLPEHVDYGYVNDFDSDMFDTAAVQIYGCDRDEAIDLAIYRNLPSRGTFGLDGSVAPSAVINDEDSAWCVDDEVDADSETAPVRGTPREMNRPCP
jgi:hypothetical protein